MVQDTNMENTRRGKITLQELFKRDLLALPREHETRAVQELPLGIGFKQKGGVYVFTNSYGEALYTGISHNVKSRVVQHLKLDRGNADLYGHLNSHKDCYVTVYYEERQAYREVYESYLIEQLQPRYNVAKTDRERV